jgi:hypothetical protein
VKSGTEIINTPTHYLRTNFIGQQLNLCLNKLHESLKLLDLHPALYILVQKEVILNTCHIVRMFVAEE